MEHAKTFARCINESTFANGPPYMKNKESDLTDMLGKLNKEQLIAVIPHLRDKLKSIPNYAQTLQRLIVCRFGSAQDRKEIYATIYGDKTLGKFCQDYSDVRAGQYFGFFRSDYVSEVIAKAAQKDDVIEHAANHPDGRTAQVLCML